MYGLVSTLQECFDREDLKFEKIESGPSDFRSEIYGHW